MLGYGEQPASRKEEYCTSDNLKKKQNLECTATLMPGSEKNRP